LTRKILSCGKVPEGFINTLREQYPEGVSTRVVDDFIKARKPKSEPSINTKGRVIEGDTAAAPVVEIPAGIGKQKSHKDRNHVDYENF
jgi:hypothetical protein